MSLSYLPLVQISGIYPNLVPHAAIRRASLLALLLVLELLALSVWLDNASLSHAAGLAWLIGRRGAWASRFVVAFAVFFVIFGYPKA